MIQYFIGALIIAGVVYRNPRMGTHTATELVHGFLKPSVLLYYVGRLYGAYLIFCALGFAGAYLVASSVDSALLLQALVPQPFIALWAYYGYVASKEGWFRYMTLMQAVKRLALLFVLFILGTVIASITISKQSGISYEEATEQVANLVSDWFYACPFLP